MESEDVAAVNVLSTGDSDIRARNIIIDDFRALRSKAYTSLASIKSWEEYERVVDMLGHSAVG
jgi:hypothetical protein